jgi:hypothetical protein
VVDVEKKRFTSHWMQQQFGKVASKMQQSCGTPARTYNTHAEEIEIKIEKEKKEKQSACVCLDDTQQSDEGGARADAGGVAAIDDNADWKDVDPF